MGTRLRVLAVAAAVWLPPIAALADTAPEIKPQTKPEPEPEPEPPLRRALVLFKEQRYPQAIPLLEAALQDPEARTDALLLLGICRYRTGELTRAEPLLREAARSSDPQTRDAAQLFLGLVFDEMGATDQASAELGRAARSPSLAGSAQRLLSARRPHRIQISLLAAPEYDGNVPLTEHATWRQSPSASSDGDFLFLAALSARPFRFGLSLGNTISYRQQLRLRDYSLLLNSTWLGYSYAGPNDRVRATAALDFALLGGSPLFLDFDGRTHYRRRLRGLWGAAAAYELRHRSYFSGDYQPLSGQTHTGRLELSYGTAPEPILFSLGYQVLREQLARPEPPLLPSDDFRAWAHGPVLRGRAKLHSRVELSLWSTFLHRVFDYLPDPVLTPEDTSRRVDLAISAETSLAVRFGGAFEAFLGGAVLYNYSNKPAFHYLKPSGYLGIVAYFGVL